MTPETYAAELDQIRTKTDTRRRDNRYDAACRALIDLGMTEEATAIRAAQDGPEVAHLDEILAVARDKLLALRHQRNAEGPPNPTTGHGFVAPVQAAIDRLGELWAVAPREPRP